MKHWGPIRCATLKKLTNAELAAGHQNCDRSARGGFGKMLGAIGAGALAVFAAPYVAAVVPLLLYIAAPILFYAGYKQTRQGLDGMAAHKFEESRRVLLAMSPPQPQPVPPTAPQPAAPVFNGQAAVELDTDITTMKTIKLAAKAAPAAQ